MKHSPLSAFLLSALCVFSFLDATTTAQAGGIALSATRIIYSASSKSGSIFLLNSDKTSRFLVKAWIEDAEHKKSTDFIITPPLFVMGPEKENAIKLVYAGKALPSDRETVFWLNVKSIPSISKAAVQNKNILQLAIQSQIKLFYRPDNLPMDSGEAPTKLHIQHINGQLKIDNPTPYYVSMINIKEEGVLLGNLMVPPLGSATLSSHVSKGEVQYQAMNDYGAATAVMTQSD